MQHDDLEESSSTAVEPPDLEPVEIDPSGRYIRYDEVLGRGSYKTVYKAFDDADGIEVAWSRIKIDALLHSAGDLERVHSEVQILKYLKHDNIMKFCSSWIDERKRTVNIITELFSSGSLKKYRMKHKTVDIRVIKRWARQILVAVDYLHSHQPPIIHRDLKCDNIFINGNRGEIKLGDLGFATVRRKPNCRSVIGTPEFMAPELYQEEYNELIDIYSFGMCMLELLTFDYPYSECDSTFKIYQKVLRGEKPDAFYKIRDPEVTAFIEKCIAPADRRSSAKDLLTDPFLYTEVLQHPHLEHSDQEGYDHHHLSSETFLQHPHIGSFVGEHFDHDSEPEVISILHDDADGSPIHIVVQKSLYNRAFLLTGERREGKSVLSLWLRIDSDRGLEVEMRVLFYLDNEFPPVTSDIVDRFGLDGEDGKYLSSLVDILLVHMFPVWNPNFDSPIKADETGSCSSRHSTDFSSVTSLRYLFELEEEAGYFTDEWEEDEKVPPVQADDLVLHAMSMFCISPADDDVSIISTDARGDKSMAVVMPPDKSCVVTTDDDDDEVRTELDMIDHQYREALSQIISRREKAIEMVRSKAALRKGSFS